MKNSTFFYADIKEIKNLKNISNSINYKDIPDDWIVLATDVKGSTKAIEEGKYKDVNMIGALCIISILNIDKNIDIPFVFGGDGAFILIPPLILEKSKQSLIAIQKISKDAYNLHLRIGAIPVKNIYKENKKILITKYKVTDKYSQAIIKGGGLDYCDTLLKNSDKYHMKDKIDENFEVNLEGLECRWQDIPSPKDEIVSILIKSFDDNHYKNILSSLDKILGNSQKRHPIIQQNLKLSFSSKKLITEASIYSKNFFMRSFILFKLKFMNLIGKILIDFNIGLWGSYKQRVASAADTEKFDDILRMVVTADNKQTSQQKRIKMKLLKLTSSLLLAGLLFTSLQAKDSEFYVGYSSGSMDNVDVDGVTAGWAMRLNTKNFQHSFGFELNTFGENENINDGSGNAGLLFFSSGYKVTESLIPYALIGYAFQDLGTTENGVSNLSSGLAYGAGIKYKFTKSLALDMNYKTYSLEDIEKHQYDINLASASLVWTFKTFK